MPAPVAVAFTASVFLNILRRRSEESLTANRMIAGEWVSKIPHSPSRKFPNPPSIHSILILPIQKPIPCYELRFLRYEQRFLSYET